MSDFTFFLKDSNVKIISDPEGNSIEKLLSLREKEKGIICGDILDSTAPGGDDRWKTEGIYNIRNIMYLLEKSDKIKFVVGNRDINKIKILQLSDIESDGSNIINLYNIGYPDLDFDAFSNWMDENSKINFKINSMNEWYPFWKFNDSKAIEGLKWDERKDTTFLDRFYSIFGADNNKDNKQTGTMSAQNTLESIYKELISLGLINKIDYDELKSFELNDKQNLINNYKAYLVLAIYRCLLIDNEISEDLKELVEENEEIKLKLENYRGALFKLLETSFLCAYAVMNKKLLLFSHGGIPQEFINGGFERAFREYNGLSNHKIQSYSNLKQLGGFSKETETKLSFDKIQKEIESSNILYQNALSSAFTNKNSMLFLLGMSASVNGFNGISRTKDISPIMPGYVSMRDNFYFSDSHDELFQIIGHVPAGYGPIVDYFYNEDESKTGWLINLDASQSFLASNQNQIGEKQSRSYLLIDESGFIKVKGSIKFSDNTQIKTYEDFSMHNTLDSNNRIKKEYNNIFTDNEINNNQFDYIKTINKSFGKLIKELASDPKMHVQFMSDKTNAVVIKSLTPGDFNKTLLILNSDNLRNFNTK